jgi:excisionase family DNA binding protein
MTSDGGKRRKGALLDYTEAAELLGVPVSTIRRAVKRGALVAVMPPGATGQRAWRVTRASVESWLREQVGQEGER